VIGVDVGGSTKKKNANALRYGVMVEDVLTSRGLQACQYAGRCPGFFKAECCAGSNCPHEALLLERFTASAAVHYAYAKAWLTTAEFELTIRDLAVLSLQNARLAARIADEWPFEPGPGPDGVSRPAVGIAINRYATALHRKRQLLTRRLLDQETDEYWAAV
jgi:hypothetical protein